MDPLATQRRFIAAHADVRTAVIVVNDVLQRDGYRSNDVKRLSRGIECVYHNMYVSNTRV